MTADVRNAPTTILALIGQPVSGNPTGAMIEAACRSVGLESGRYVSIDVSPHELAVAISALRALRVAGFHVTIPHKVAVRDHLDSLTSAAEATGAVNCVRREGDALVGDNTDGRGFLVGLGATIHVRGSRMLVLGAGGAARAVAVEAALAGAASVAVANRSAGRAEALAELVRRAGCAASVVPWELPLEIPSGTQVVVNATSLGMTDPNAAPEVAWGDCAGVVAADVVIRPSTVFLERAAVAGCATLDGTEMLIEQAIEAFRWWTGLDPDRASMRSALAGALE